MRGGSSRGRNSAGAGWGEGGCGRFVPDIVRCRDGIKCRETATMRDAGGRSELFRWE